jgi:hypothetical protein
MLHPTECSVCHRVRRMPFTSLKHHECNSAAGRPLSAHFSLFLATTTDIGAVQVHAPCNNKMEAIHLMLAAPATYYTKSDLLGCQ